MHDVGSHSRYAFSSRRKAVPCSGTAGAVKDSVCVPLSVPSQRSRTLTAPDIHTSEKFTVMAVGDPDGVGGGVNPTFSYPLYPVEVVQQPWFFLKQTPPFPLSGHEKPAHSGSRQQSSSAWVTDPSFSAVVHCSLPDGPPHAAGYPPCVTFHVGHGGGGGPGGPGGVGLPAMLTRATATAPLERLRAQISVPPICETRIPARPSTS
mmetsp:Transcript_85/g.192  ORF Transcript_85/g.192 Transcript_85/m.192 type:complete len:206 (+) Transcript_85:15-632(+)